MRLYTHCTSIAVLPCLHCDSCRKSFLLTKAGKPVAKLCSIDDDVTEILPDGTVRGEPIRRPLVFVKKIKEQS